MKSLRVYIDFKSPGAYLAVKPTLALAEKTDTVIDWQPIVTRQQPVPAEQPDEDRGATHRRVRAIARRDTHLLYAGVQNIPMNFPQEAFPATDLALAVLTTLPSPKTNFVTKAFTAYWDEGADLNDLETVAALIEAAGFEAMNLAGLDSASVLEAMSEQAINDGVIDAPGYVIAGQVFVGREHLPWIEELLQQSAATA